MTKILVAALTVCASIAAAHAGDNHIQIAQADTSTKGLKTPAQPNETQPGQTDNKGTGSAATSTSNSGGTMGRSSTGATRSESSGGTASGSSDDTGKSNTTRRSRSRGQMKG